MSTGTTLKVHEGTKDFAELNAQQRSVLRKASQQINALGDKYDKAVDLMMDTAYKIGEIIIKTQKELGEGVQRKTVFDYVAQFTDRQQRWLYMCEAHKDNSDRVTALLGDSLDFSVKGLTRIAKADDEEIQEAYNKIEHPDEQSLLKALKEIKEAVVRPEGTDVVTFAKEQIDPIAKALLEAANKISKLPDDEGFELLRQDRSALVRALRELRATLVYAKPVESCPVCRGDGCPKCGNLGWVNNKVKRELKKQGLTA